MNTLKSITLLTSILMLYACQEDSNHLINSDQLEQVASGAFHDSSPVNQEVYIKVSEFLETNPVEGLLEPELNYHEWIMDQESIEESTKQELLSSPNTIKSLAFYTYNQEIDGWDVFLLSARDGDLTEVVKGDALELDAVEYETLASGEKSPKKAKKKKKKRKPINVDEKGCTKRVCDGGYCHEFTFVPCKGSRGMQTCTVLGAPCDTGGNDDSLIGSILKFEFEF
ncbi:hypothetical protein [Ekhidna sp.]|uniref:hypothetical protein n=1 Tax=Ekhidna sp. TaxID=2608089 RepID=UPI003298916A